MGIYHLMGLGRSPGAVIGPISYLADRYRRWNGDDQRFFARSGEARQREAGEKVGDIQALVLFTTREVLDGQIPAFDYVDNPPRRVAKGPVKNGGPMKEILRQLLGREWPGISGGRPNGEIFWCEVDRVVEINSQMDPQQPLVPQVIAMADEAGLSAAERQPLPLLVNPPSLHFVAVALLAELHGRCGYFPAHLRVRPVEDAIPPRYEVAEILDLQGVRGAARQGRMSMPG